jgi:hypothetical protein
MSLDLHMKPALPQRDITLVYVTAETTQLSRMCQPWSEVRCEHASWKLVLIGSSGRESCFLSPKESLASFVLTLNQPRAIDEFVNCLP